jgi:hypothetical protein
MAAMAAAPQVVGIHGRRLEAGSSVTLHPRGEPLPRPTGGDCNDASESLPWRKSWQGIAGLMPPNEFSTSPHGRHHQETPGHYRRHYHAGSAKRVKVLRLDSKKGDQFDRGHRVGRSEAPGVNYLVHGAIPWSAKERSS